MNKTELNAEKINNLFNSPKILETIAKIQVKFGNTLQHNMGVCFGQLITYMIATQNYDITEEKATNLIQSIYDSTHSIKSSIYGSTLINNKDIENDRKKSIDANPYYPPTYETISKFDEILHKDCKQILSKQIKRQVTDNEAYRFMKSNLIDNGYCFHGFNSMSLSSINKNGLHSASFNSSNLLGKLYEAQHYLTLDSHTTDMNFFSLCPNNSIDYGATSPQILTYNGGGFSKRSPLISLSNILTGNTEDATKEIFKNIPFTPTPNDQKEITKLIKNSVSPLRHTSLIMCPLFSDKKDEHYKHPVGENEEKFSHFIKPFYFTDTEDITVDDWQNTKWESEIKKSNKDDSPNLTDDTNAIIKEKELQSNLSKTSIASYGAIDPKTIAEEFGIIDVPNYNEMLSYVIKEYENLGIPYQLETGDNPTLAKPNDATLDGILSQLEK